MYLDEDVGLFMSRCFNWADIGTSRTALDTGKRVVLKSEEKYLTADLRSKNQLTI